ncbi:glycoside hydrolase family 30 protein [Dickeya solani]|uniref:Glycoside hydrolase family 30 beta sandwich domain-containing protein n=2 Tax=Dickeya solani TaxID=1089444 RepID=A0ABU4EDN1_9GAMM|nr:glycoside hydrolase family 30 beta sandwich domain-containing protein [Dickeya solani]MCA6998958.1 xylanase [Dickeya solani]MCZ0823519.1 xylanase [Dickeya solani]MDV6995773.1 glycoside hydrolase family 30 beta sandwich domain-containing protein [Dickeya solani]MDV7003794.1 glycoside hydrolase family 30 beta sandwich domain-containing protein [Dickeya solani]MDV7040257.1 glycoside hydrolase family 30 beta sandwich domain-containing protein [Dickeya solani]
MSDEVGFYNYFSIFMLLRMDAMNRNVTCWVRHCLRAAIVVSVTAGSLSAYADTVKIDAKINYQIIQGFGGMNGAGWINDLTTEQINTAFGNDAGQIGLSIMRIRIDPDSNKWNIQVPSARQAISLGAQLMATPWTPPAYMKSNNSLINGGRLLPAYYSAYTSHLLDFSKYMQTNSASLYAISIQNEPDWKPDYESCEWSGDEFKNYLKSQGSKFGSLNIIVGESLGFNPKLTDPVLNDSDASKYVAIVGGHLYGTTPKPYPLAQNAGKQIWMTEHYVDSKQSANNWSSALDVATELNASMVANYNAYVWWYIRRSYGLLTEDGKVSKRGYVMSQYARFVRPGFQRIQATENPQSNVHLTAYKNSDGKMVIVAVNTNDSDQMLSLNISNANVGKFEKYSTSAVLNVEYGGTSQVDNSGKATVWLNPLSVTTFVGK